MEKEINHWKCSVCGQILTYIEEEELPSARHHQHFDISRSYKELYVEDGCIEEEIKDRNTKMEIQLCEECFNKVLNESRTLGRLFDTPNGRIY